MALPDLSKPEHEVFKILWQEGDLSFGEVHDKLTTGWAYTTTKTVMDRMVKKGLLERNKINGVYLYTPLITRPQGLARMLKYFSENVLGVDTGSVVSMFAKNNQMTRTEIKELKQLIGKIDDSPE